MYQSDGLDRHSKRKRGNITMVVAEKIRFPIKICNIYLQEQTKVARYTGSVH